MQNYINLISKRTNMDKMFAVEQNNPFCCWKNDKTVYQQKGKQVEIIPL